MILPVPVYVAAGGRSSRFGSDKARARLPNDSLPDGGLPHSTPDAGPMLVEAVVEALRPIAAEVTLVADRAERFADLGLPTITDLHPGAGPIAALEAALRDRAAGGWLFFVSCDLAGLEPTWVELLARAVERHGPTPEQAAPEQAAPKQTPPKQTTPKKWPRAAAFCRPGDGPRRWDPLFALYHTEALPHVERAIARGQFAMWRLLETLEAIALPHPADWGNATAINTPADLQTYIERSVGTIQPT